MFHISHSPMLPTKAQMQRFANWESPAEDTPAAAKGDGSGLLASAAGAPPPPLCGDTCSHCLSTDCKAGAFANSTAGYTKCLTCTRNSFPQSTCTPRARQAYCAKITGTGVGTDPVSLCTGPNHNNGPNTGGFTTCSSLVFRSSQVTPAAGLVDL